ncbi:MAG: FkbM family methyltransferase [Anaerolineales bacterium]
MRFVLNRVSPNELKVVSVAAGQLIGKRMLLDLKLEKDYWLGNYEPSLVSSIIDMVKPGMIAYDLGANIGYVTLLLAQTVGPEGHVFAFEPLASNIERLQQNITMNGMEKRISVHFAAVAAYNGKANFLIGPSIGTGKLEGSVGRKENRYTESTSVQAIALDDFIYRDGNPKPDIIKMDIEGGEVLAIQGMERIFHNARPLVFLELHGFEAAEVVWTKLMEADYQFFQMRSGYPKINSLNDLGWKSYIIAKPI